MRVELRFEMGDASARELAPLITAAFREHIPRYLARPQDYRAVSPGEQEGPVLDLSAIEPGPIDLREPEISVRESGQGLTAEFTEIWIGVVSGLGAEAIAAIFRSAVWPALTMEFGHRPLGRHVAGGDSARADNDDPDR